MKTLLSSQTAEHVDWYAEWVRGVSWCTAFRIRWCISFFSCLVQLRNSNLSYKNHSKIKKIKNSKKTQTKTNKIFSDLIGNI